MCPVAVTTISSDTSGSPCANAGVAPSAATDFNTRTISSGHNAFDATLADITVNQCEDSIAIPVGLPPPHDPTRIETRQLAPQVHLIGGSTHNSVAIGLRDYVVVVEAPLSEARSLAVIEEVTRLFPGRSIRYLINTHQHFDHIGGLRTYTHIGATIVTHARNHAFYNRDVLNYTPRLAAPDLLSLMPPTELTEGYTYELVRENYTLSDGRRTINVHCVQPLEHGEGMLMVFLPRERLLIEADLLDTHEGARPDQSDGHGALQNMVRAYDYRVDRIVPVHGQPIGWSVFIAAAEAQKRAAVKYSVETSSIGECSTTNSHGESWTPACPD